MLECVADRRLDAERFLPTLPIVVTIDTRLAERADFQPSEIGLRKAADRNIEVARYRKFLSKLVPPMLARAEALAAARGAGAMIEAALAVATRDAGRGTVPPAGAARGEPVDQRGRNRHRDRPSAMPCWRPCRKSRLRLDAVRFVVSADFLALR